MKQPPQQPPASPPIIINNPAPASSPAPPQVKTAATAPQSGAVAVPIPVKKPVSLSSSKHNSYVDQHKATDLHLPEEMEVKEMEVMDEMEVQSKFGITWVASDDFDDEERNQRGIVSNLYNKDN